MTNWKEEASATAVLFSILERGKQFPIGAGGPSTILLTDDMERRGLLARSGGVWAATTKGREAMGKAIKVHDVLRQMEIYANVDVARVLSPEELDPDGSSCRPDMFDPRFDPKAAGQDMRLAVIAWLAQTTNRHDANLHTIVFLQKLGSGKLSGPGAWSAIESGATFGEIEEIVRTAYKWTDAAPGDREESGKRMAAIYAAGQIEVRKREGSSCSECGIPLVFYEQDAASRQDYLHNCPSCNRSFDPPTPVGQQDTFACPKCSAAIFPGEPRCGGCGALIDFSLPSGTVQTETVATTETVWTNTYGYVSYGWLNPWDPFADALLFGALFYSPYW